MRTESTTKAIAKVGEIIQNNPNPKIAQSGVVPILSEIALSLATIADGLGETLRTEGASMDAFSRAAQVDTPMKQTNADRIRAMTDEELAVWISKHDCHTNLYGYDPTEAILEWLKEKVTENG